MALADEFDLKSLTDDGLTALAQGVVNEQERRRTRSSIPAQIELLRQKYIEDGGDPSDLEPNTKGD